MKLKKSHFWYNSRQRNGVFLLVILIVILQSVFFFVDFSSKETMELSSAEIQKFERAMDSLDKLAIQKRNPKMYPFNPSYISDFKGYQLGMSTQEIDRLLAFRAKGNYINSVAQFQEVTKVSDSLLTIISPYFKFPEWASKNRKNKNRDIVKNVIPVKAAYHNETLKDLNQATAEELMHIKGIGTKLSTRIVKYRKRLGGFLLNEQLFEVYGLDRTVANEALKHYQVLKKPKIQKLNINEATFKQVLAIVYIDYELTKKIFNYRDEVTTIKSIEDLKQIAGFPLEKFDRIALYLQAK